MERRASSTSCDARGPDTDFAADGHVRADVSRLLTSDSDSRAGRPSGMASLGYSSSPRKQSTPETLLFQGNLLPPTVMFRVMRRLPVCETTVLGISVSRQLYRCAADPGPTSMPNRFNAAAATVSSEPAGTSIRHRTAARSHLKAGAAADNSPLHDERVQRPRYL